MSLKALWLCMACVTSTLHASNELSVMPSLDVSHDRNPYLNVPEISSGVGLLSRQQEKNIGEKVLREVRHQLPLLEDMWLEEQIQQLFSQIYTQTGLGQTLGLVIVKDKQINAFAVPGGMFAINAGLVTSAKNMDEVAGVVAHEIAHVTQRHYSRSQESFKGQGLLSLAGLLAGIAIASQVPEAGTAVMLGSQAALLDQKLSYNRNQEREADRVGMQYMAIAGYKPISMADFFETMHRSTSQLSYLPDFWLTHPLTAERISEARLRARQFPQSSTPYTDTTQDKFEMMRWRMMVLSGYADLNQLKDQTKQHNIAASLALASYYIQRSNFKDAESILTQLTPKAVHKHLYTLIRADLYLAKKQPKMALDVLMPLHLVAPENKVFSFKVAEAYRLTQQYDQALSLLTPLSIKYPADPQIWQALYQTELARHSPFKEIQVLRYKAEEQFWRGKEEEAIKALLHAQRLVEKIDNHFLKEKIASRLKQMQDTRQFKL